MFWLFFFGHLNDSCCTSLPNSARVEVLFWKCHRLFQDLLPETLVTPIPGWKDGSQVPLSTVSGLFFVLLHDQFKRGVFFEGFTESVPRSFPIE